MFNKYFIEIKWGIIFALMTLAWVTLERLAGFHDVRIEQHMVVTNLISIPAVAIFVFALLDKKRNYYNGQMTYLQGFVSGLIVSLVVTLLSPLTQSIVSYVITPDFFDNFIQYSVESGKKTLEEAQAYFNNKSYVIQGLIGAPVMGIITSAVVAIFTKTRKK